LDRAVVFCENLTDPLIWRLLSPWAHTVAMFGNVALHKLKGYLKFMYSFTNTFAVSVIHCHIDSVGLSWSYVLGHLKSLMFKEVLWGKIMKE